MKTEIQLTYFKAQMLAVELKGKAMEAENQAAVLDGCYPPFTKEHFNGLAKEAELLSGKVLALVEPNAVQPSVNLVFNTNSPHYKKELIRHPNCFDPDHPGCDKCDITKD